MFGRTVLEHEIALAREKSLSVQVANDLEGRTAELAEARADLKRLQAQQANISLKLFTMLADAEAYRKTPLGGNPEFVERATPDGHN